MTLILAAKHREGIVTVADTLVQRIKKKNELEELIYWHKQKVRAIGDGKMIMGFSGTLNSKSENPLEDHYSFLDDALNNRSVFEKINPNEPLKTIRRIIYKSRLEDFNKRSHEVVYPNYCTEGEATLDSNAPILDYPSRHNAYMFGVYQTRFFRSDKTNLYIFNPDDIMNPGVFESQCYALGYSGRILRPKLSQALEDNPSLSRLIESMKKILENEKSNTDVLIKGLQVGLLNSKGYQILELSEN